MLKKLVAVIAAAVMVLAMGVTAFADNQSPEVGTQGWVVFGSYTGDVPSNPDLDGYERLTNIFELKAEGNVTFPTTVTVPKELYTKDKAGYTDITLAYYNSATGKWDYSKEIADSTFVVDHTCPAVVLGKKAEHGKGLNPPSGKGSSPATGSNTNATAFAVVAGVLAIAAVSFAMRKRNA